MTDTKISLPLRSVSQLNQYCACPQAYKLARIDKVWVRPAAWLPQGTAFHTVAETYEKRRNEGNPMTLDEAMDLFKAEYSKDVGALTEETPNFEWWFWSGPYNGQRDVERRWEIGLEQVEKFIEWRETEGQEIWTTPDGTPAIELYFEIELEGIIVRGYIDAVVVVDGKLRVRDYKTGNKPGDDFQLGVYALALRMLYGVEVTEGDYFMVGKKGKKPKPTPVYDLTPWTYEEVRDRFHEVEEGIAAGRFDPDPDPDKCGFCDVNYSCPVFRD
ncbi:Cas4 exonuclease [Mycobacterium phage Jabith]|nr:Cas4 exonuclease [Mycobacterium phage Jabith]AXC33434.1 Cas4 exonuclease [Mycobacterium phage Ebony]QFG05050.1 Cas4 exonuclease [Mycobacterium phage Hutc2]